MLPKWLEAKTKSNSTGTYENGKPLQLNRMLDVIDIALYEAEVRFLLPAVLDVVDIASRSGISTPNVLKTKF